MRTLAHVSFAVLSFSHVHPRPRHHAQSIRSAGPVGRTPTTGTTAAAEPLERRTLLSAGDLDVTFGGGGIAFADPGTASYGGDLVAAPGGKVVAVRNSYSRYTESFTVTRLTAGGTQDNSFGIEGRATPPWVFTRGDEEFHGQTARGAAVAPDAKVVVVGFAHRDPDDEFGTELTWGFVLRLRADGSMDPAFGGGDGVVTLAGGPFVGAAIDSAGRVLTTRDGAAYRFRADGAADTSFGGGDGVAPLPSPTGTFSVTDVALAAGGGAIVVAGAVSDSSLAVAQLDPAGNADARFGGGDGIVTNRIGAGGVLDGAPAALAVGPSGEIVLAGRRGGDAAGRIAVVRYTPAGALDTSFGTGGVTALGPSGTGGASAVAVQRDGKVLAAGADGFAFNLVRSNRDGSPDRAFGPGGAAGDGVVTTDFEPSPGFSEWLSGPFGLALTAGDKIVTAGSISHQEDGFSSDGHLVAVGYLGGATGADTLAVAGTAGNDRVVVSRSADGLNLSVAVNGVNTATRPLVGLARVELSGLGGNDRLEVASSLRVPVVLDGGAGHDTLRGGGGRDTLLGGAGNDTLDGRGGADLFRGGDGVDTADYTARRNSVSVGIGTAPDDGERGEGDNVFTDVENVWGGRGNDTLRGSAANNRLVGGEGDDTLVGRGGRDTLLGAAGNDTLTARDGDSIPDTLDGGPGTDAAQSDRRDILRNIEGTPNADVTPPRVVATSVPHGSTIAPGAVTLTFRFSEPMSPATLDRLDVYADTGLHPGQYPDRVGYDATGTLLTVEFDDLPEDNWWVGLLSGDGRFEDAAGNDLDGETPLAPVPPNVSGNGVAGGDFEFNLVTDAPAPRPLAVPDPLPAGGASIVGDSTLMPGDDVDHFTLNLKAGQTVGVSATVSVEGMRSGMTTALELRDPSGAVVAAATAAERYLDVTLPPTTAAATGTYTLTVRGAPGEVGRFRATVTVNDPRP